MTLYIVDDEVVTETEAKKFILENNIDQGYFDDWVNDTYAAMDILTYKELTLEYLKEVYMEDYDLRDAEVYPVEISEDAVKAIVAKFLEEKQK